MANKLNKTVRYNGQLSNGQYVYAEFTLGRFPNGMYHYDTSFIIADSPKTCRYWLNGNKNHADKHGKCLITGKSGLEGLIWMKGVMEDFIECFLPKGVMLMVRGADDKRYNAYKRYMLKKMPQFTEWQWGDEDHLAYVK